MCACFRRLFRYCKKGISYARCHLWLRVCCIFGVSVLAIALFYQEYMEIEYTDFLMEKEHLMESGVLEMMKKNLNYSLAEYIENGISIAIDDSIYETAESLKNSPEDTARLTLNLELTFSTFASASGNILNLALVLPEGSCCQYDRLHTGENRMWGREDTEYLGVMYQQVYSRANSRTVPRYLVSTYPDRHPMGEEGSRVFHIFYPVIGRNSSFEKMNSMLCITYSMDILQPLLDVGQDGDYTASYITDRFDTILLHSDPDQIGRTQGAYLSRRSIQVLDTPLEKLGWNLHIALDESAMSGSVERILQNGMVVYVALLLILCVVFYFQIKQFMSPLLKIQRAMAETGSGGKRKRVEVEGDNEIWSLAGVYNEMIGRLEEQEMAGEESHQMALLALERQHQAEREALETQINSHFLCNTLMTINYEAMEQGNFKVSLLIKKLSNILRYTFDQKCQDVYLSQEFAWIEQYLYLQKARFEDVFDYEVEFREEYAGWPCCKLMLQPFVENAILHGFEGRESGGFLSVTAEGAGAFLRCTVRDNGCGIPPDRAARIQEILNGKEQAENPDLGIGIRNVASRMRIFYGEQVRILLRSSLEEGTEFVFILPFPEKREVELNENYDYRG